LSSSHHRQFHFGVGVAQPVFSLVALVSFLDLPLRSWRAQSFVTCPKELQNLVIVLSIILELSGHYKIPWFGNALASDLFIA
jgi:hypothetical protein